MKASYKRAAWSLALITVLFAATLARGQMPPMRYPPGTTDRPNRRSSAFVTSDDTGARRTSYRYPSASRPSTTTARLWSEQPMYFQFLFAIDRVKTLAPQHPEWRTTEPFKSLLAGDMKTSLASRRKGLPSSSWLQHTPGMTTVGIRGYREATGPRRRGIRRPSACSPRWSISRCCELLAYLRANGFKTFIVSGGGIEFMRPWTETVYGIPPEQVVGSQGETEVRAARRQARADAGCRSAISSTTRPGKPVGIQRHIGRRPIAAFGNSDGDHADAAVDRRRRRCRVSRGSCATPMPQREWAYDRAVAHRQARQGAGRGAGEELDRRRHEEGLEAHLCFR
mgnify:CR=1 FL=1